jgi:hypothetical protein
MATDRLVYSTDRGRVTPPPREPVVPSRPAIAAVRDGAIEIQGDHRDRIAGRPRALGHAVTLAGGPAA